MNDTMEKPTIYYTTTNMERPIADDISAVRAVYQMTSLPKGYTTEEGVKELFETILNIGEVGDIKITQKSNYNRRLQYDIKTFGAIVEIKHHKNNQAVYELHNTTTTVSPSSVMLFMENSFQWENGDIMTHLSIRMVEETNFEHTEIPPLDLKEDDWKSLYIPYIHETLQLENRDDKITPFYPRKLTDFIENEMKLGKVSRIDFVDRNDSNEMLHGKSAYIHFTYWNNNPNVNYLRTKLNTDGSFRQRGYYDGVKQRQFYTRDLNGDKKKGYLLFKINNKPLPETSTDLNIHQMAAENEYLLNKVKEYENQISELNINEIIAKNKELLNKVKEYELHISELASEIKNVM